MQCQKPEYKFYSATKLQNGVEASSACRQYTQELDYSDRFCNVFVNFSRSALPCYYVHKSDIFIQVRILVCDR
ncbi:MAG: hypothetical protein V7K97_11910 [Nostoc sp.]|uniref:hypothetical protein n=1 Tax=Nostoc sp. TaxID=1180 RepID=UPI002FF6BC16